MASYSTIIPSQLNDYIGRSQFIPGSLSSWSDARACPDTMSDMLFIMKTGGTATFKRLPVHFETTLRCVKHSIIVSDIEVEIGKSRSIDVLADLDPDTIKSEDFYLYNMQKLYHNNHGGDFESLVKDLNGWTLDKYKFIPMLRRAWLAGKEHNVEWYVFIEADTSIDLGNLRRVLDEVKKTHHPRTTKHYLGSENYIQAQHKNFAHGGSGYVISRKGMEDSVGKSPDDFVKYWGPRAAGECCGDFVVGRALLGEGNFTVHDSRPFFQGANPTDAWYADDLWCHPVVTMHHVTAQQVAELWSMSSQGNAYWRRPIVSYNQQARDELLLTYALVSRRHHCYGKTYFDALSRTTWCHCYSIGTMLLLRMIRWKASIHTSSAERHAKKQRNACSGTFMMASAVLLRG
jgi:hypothetical protein